MKKYFILSALAVFFAVFTSCEKKEDTILNSIPVIESLVIKSGDIATLNDSIYFDARVSAPLRPLSTLEVELVADDMVLDKKSIRTKGMSADLKNVALFTPFNPYMVEEELLQMNFTLINVDGVETKQQKTLKSKRPELPSKLYVVMDDKSVVELNVNQSNPYLYESKIGDYPSSFSCKVATSEDLSQAKLIWNGIPENNVATIGNEFGADVKFSYDNWVIRKIMFDTFSFSFDVEGFRLAARVNNTPLSLSGEYLHAQISFTKGEEFTIEGLEDVTKAYNRDFFEYNPVSGKYRFLGETGSWDVYYSLTYNYIWVNRMTDTAPVAFWMIGQGFTSVPRWHDDFTKLGWSWTDVKQLAYMRPIGDDKYQTHVYLSDKPEWGVDMKMYSSLDENNYQQAIFSNDLFFGDKAGFQAAGPDSADIVNNDEFAEGYYRVTLDVSQGLEKAKVEFEKL